MAEISPYDPFAVVEGAAFLLTYDGDEDGTSPTRCRCPNNLGLSPQSNTFTWPFTYTFTYTFTHPFRSGKMKNHIINRIVDGRTTCFRSSVRDEREATSKTRSSAACTLLIVVPNSGWG